MASTSTPTISQYHHFIPRFILRNFAHPYRPPRTSSNGSGKRGKNRRKDGYHLGEPMLHAINLAEATAALIETPVSRTFGVTDMYRDFEDATNQHYLEEQLSHLESRVAIIIHEIFKKFQAGEGEVWIIRPERDILRKFLFIMKYRGSTAHKRFYSGNGEGYSADDQEHLLKYMHDKGFRRPADVWFNNIKAMLELKMDLKGEWMAKLQEAMYPNDAQWYIAHMQLMYLALCTPSGPDDEFLLTENAYSIHEGPVSALIDLDTGEETTTSYTEFHAFAAVSPKLIMVLRSHLLPNLEEDSDARIRRRREAMFQETAAMHNNPSNVKSLLQDLPVTKARNSYTKLVDGRLTYLDGEDGTPRSDHKYCFRFFPISTEHVNKINCIMLEQSYSISKIAFKSLPAACKTLEYYLTMPCQDNSFKTCGFAPNDPRLMCLRKLEQAAKELGSDATAIYQVQKSKLDVEEELEALGRMFASVPLTEPTESMRLYARLGGSAATMPKDLDQSAKMLKLRIKIDVWTQGLDESFREKIRGNLRELFCQFPARCVWYYLKRTRFMILGGATVRSQEHADFLLDGPEDFIVTVKDIFRTTADLCRMMHFVTLNGIHLIKNPDFDLAAEITLNEEGAKRLMGIKYLAFETSGSICDCEERARLHMDMFRCTRLHENYGNPFWTEEENDEMAVRVLVKKHFADLIGNALSNSDVQALESILFGIVYPSLGSEPLDRRLGAKGDLTKLNQ